MIKDIVYFLMVAALALTGIYEAAFMSRPGMGIIMVGIAYIMLEVKSE